MEIRKKLGLQFILIVAILQLFSSIAIYFSFAEARQEEFFDRLESKATSVGQMLIDIDEIDTLLLRKIERNNPLSLPNERVIIFSHDNQMVFSNDERNDITLDGESIDEVRLNDIARSKIGAWEILGKFYKGENDRLVVFVAATDIYGMHKLARLRLILTLVFIAGLVFVYLAGRLFSGRAVRPIRRVIDQVGQIGTSNLHARVDGGTENDEIAQLADSFNNLLRKIEETFSIQKSFIANASHELNTPLTVITGQIEVVLLKARSNDEYKKSILNVLDDIRNLNHLSRRLLLLAQASSELTGISFMVLRIDDTLWQIRSEMKKRMADSVVNIQISSDLDDESYFQVRGNETLLKTALMNIIENGCKYSDDHTCLVSVSHVNGFLQISMSDHGKGIPTRELQLIFEPFYRSSITTNMKGHGIGLSLAEKVVKLHEGWITVTSTVGMGSDFIVTLPLINTSIMRTGL